MDVRPAELRRGFGLALGDEALGRVDIAVAAVIPQGGEHAAVIGRPGIEVRRLMGQGAAGLEMGVRHRLEAQADLGDQTFGQSAAQGQCHVDGLARVDLAVAPARGVPEAEIIVADHLVVVDRQIEGERIDLALAGLEIGQGKDEAVPALALGAVEEGDVERFGQAKGIQQKRLEPVAEADVRVPHGDGQEFGRESGRAHDRARFVGGGRRRLGQVDVRGDTEVIGGEDAVLPFVDRQRRRQRVLFPERRAKENEVDPLGMSRSFRSAASSSGGEETKWTFTRQNGTIELRREGGTEFRIVFPELKYKPRV